MNGANVYFVSSDYSRTYASAVSDGQGKFTWYLPEGISGKLIAVHDGYQIYERDYTTAPGDLRIEMEPDYPPTYQYFVSGKITEDDGTTPVFGSLVTFIAEDGSTYRTFSGYDGSYMMELKFGQADGVLIVYKDMYIPEFAFCEWTGPEQMTLQKDVELLKYSDGAATYFGIADNQASYDLSLYYQGELVTSTTYTEPFTLYFKDYALDEDGDTLYLDDLNEAHSGFTYKLTSTPISEDYTFQSWDIKTYNEANAISRTDIKPVYVSSVGPDPDPGTGGGAEVNAQTGDDSFVIVSLIICAMFIALFGIFVSTRKKQH